MLMKIFSLFVFILHSVKVLVRCVKCSMTKRKYIKGIWQNIGEFVSHPESHFGASIPIGM